MISCKTVAVIFFLLKSSSIKNCVVMPYFWLITISSWGAEKNVQCPNGHYSDDIYKNFNRIWCMKKKHFAKLIFKVWLNFKLKATTTPGVPRLSLKWVFELYNNMWMKHIWKFEMCVDSKQILWAAREPSVHRTMKLDMRSCQVNCKVTDVISLLTAHHRPFQ